MESGKVASLDDEECCAVVPATSATVEHLGKLLHFSETQFSCCAQRYSDIASSQSGKANLFLTLKKLMEAANVSLGVKIHAAMDL